MDRLALSKSGDRIGAQPAVQACMFAWQASGMSTLRFKVRFPYRVRAAQPRKREPVTFVLQGEVDIDIRSFSVDQVELAVDLVHLKEGKEINRYVRYAVGDKLYGPHSGVQYGVPAPGGRLQRLEKGGDWREFLSSGWSAEVTRSLIEENRVGTSPLPAGGAALDTLPANVTKVVDDEEASTRELVTKVLGESFIFVDGVLHRERRAPQIEIYHQMRNGSYATIADDPDRADVLFSPLRMQEAMKFLEEGAPGIRAKIFTPFQGKLEIRKWDRELVGPLGEREHNAARMLSVMLHRFGPHIGEMPAERIEQLAQMSRLRDRARDGDIEAASDALPLLEGFRNVGLAIPRLSGEAMAELIRTVELAIESINRSPPTPQKIEPGIDEDGLGDAMALIMAP